MMKEKYNFIFPHWVARRMRRVNPKTALAVHGCAITAILFGLSLLVIYRTVTMENGFLVEAFVIFNLIAGWIFLTAAAAIDLRQYKSLKEFE